MTNRTLYIPERRSPDAIIRSIIERIKEYYPQFGADEEALLKKAYLFAKKAHEGQKRASGDPYITHTLRATEILLSIRPNLETICACILHDIIGDTEYTAQSIEDEFGKEIRFLCEGVEKITQVRVTKTETQSEYEKFQKLFVALAEDIRIIFIKLADRIHNLETLEFLPKEKWNRILRESKEVYSPVADRLRLFSFKTMIEDYCLEIEYPEVAKRIQEEIEELKTQRYKFFEKIEKEIHKTLYKSELIPKHIQGREKSLHSIYKKLKQKKLNSVHELNDIFGFRIILETKEECYQALGILHSAFKPIPRRFKDYIAVPKTNGYQSLHTTLLGVSGSHTPIEVQIRTEQMHNDCEYGPAAHWAYKKKRSSSFDKEYLEKTRWISEEIEQEKLENPKEFFEVISKRILEEQIYVFTRTGDIKILPNQSTPIDFAYSIHTDIGDTCIGAKVNNKIKPLDHRLQSGDFIEIMTRTGRKPNPEWIDFVKTGKAKSKIRTYINTLKKEREGKQTDTEKSRRKERAPSVFWKNTVLPQKRPNHVLIIDGESDIVYRMAKCCNPHAGVPIVGYHALGIGAVIHSARCKEIENLDPKRFVEAYFVITKKIEIQAKNRFHILNDISRCMTDSGVSIWSNTVKRKNKNEITLRFTLHSMNEDDFDEMTDLLKKTDSVISVREIKSRKKGA